MDFSQSLSEWAKDKPLSILQLDPADRAVLKIADERDAIQKKTFTKWLNKHLKKTYTCLHVCYSCPSCCTPGVNRHVDDLFDDLRDGHNLISLLEVLSGELLPRERGRLRFHQLQNVQVALDFLKSRNIRLVNIRPEDIVDGNPKLTLGLIWTIILHFQISDIITGLTDETVTAREALLKWAQRTTERYPGVRITDFTKSWKDGLAFNAILHRNRPDLLDFRSLKARNARDNLEVAFSLAEKEFGITRLLDPEDVDTPEPDEKSLITYISSMYDVFPEPPAYHPFADEEKNRKTEEYTELAKSVQKWIVETLETFKNQKISHSLIDMKNLLLESSKFRSDVLPKQQRNKQRLTTLYKDIQKLGRHTSHVEFSKNLDIDEIEKMWNKLIATLQDRDQKIKDEISRLEKLQRMAEKIGREFKLCDVKLEDIERRIKEEEKRITRLYLLDAKQNCDQIESDFKHIDSMLKSLQKDITSLEDKKYHQVKDLQLRLKICTQKYRALQEIFHTNLLLPLSERSEDKKVIKQKHIFNEKTPEINKNLPSLKEHFDWIEKKQKRINSLEIGEDNQTIKASLEQLRNELKAIEQYNKKINSSVSQKVSKEVCETQYNEEIENLQTAYKELIALVNTRVEEAELLLDFVQSATKALKWMTDKEEIEVTRDWSAKNLNLMELEHHQESLTSDLEKREIQFNTIQNCGENLLSQKHPSSKCIEGYLNKMQDRWSWILQLTLCLEIHLRNAQVYYQFFKETKECEQWIKKAEEKLNTTFSKTVVTVDEGERYLKQMEALKTDLTRYNDIIKDLIQRSNVVIPIRQRKTISSKSTTVISLCSYKHCDTSIVKDCKYGLKEISNKMWKISAPNGKEVVVPGVCFVIPPPDSEAVELSQSLRKRYEEVLRLWSTKQKKLRQSLIFATIKVVKSWDVSQLKSMDVAQRESIMHALNTDAEKLIQEGSESESSLLKLKQEMEQCNVSFQALLKKLNVDETEKSPKSASRKISDTIVGLQNILSEKERFLTKKLIASIVYDLDSLENLVIEHKDFEISLRNLEDQVEDTIQSFKGTNKKPSALQVKYDNLVKTWTKLWDFSNLYIEKLKATEVCITKLNDAIQNVSNIEVKLASSSNMSSKLEDLQNSHDTFLLVFQDDMQVSQVFIDELQQSIGKLKSVLQQIKSKQGSHVDITKLESDAKKLLSRWDRSKAQIVERLRSCGASSELLRSYKNKIEKDNVWISETTVKMNSLKTIRKMTTKEIEMTIEPAMDLYSNISEKGSSIEETNILGSRYIREAKIYDLRLKHYKESLEEEHPSLDASFQKNITDNCGADDVGFELENLNQRYTYLLQEILDYLEDLKEVFTVQQKQKWVSITNAGPVALKTFKSYINQVPNLDQGIEEQQQFYQNIKAFPGSSISCVSEIEKESFLEADYFPLQKRNQHMKEVTQKASYSNEIQIDSSNEKVEFEGLCDIKGIYNSKTKKMVNLLEAFEQNIVDFDKLEITDLNSGRKLSFGSAVTEGFINQDFQEKISTKCGIYLPDTKDELSLVEAMQNHVYDVKNKTLLNPQDGKPISLTDAFHIGVIKKTGIKSLIDSKLIQTTNLSILEAMEKEFVDPKTGLFREPISNLSIHFKEALSKGYINIKPLEVYENGFTLCDAIDQNIIHDETGQIVDVDSGEKYTIDNAIVKGLLRSNTYEIVDVAGLEILPLSVALKQGVINAKIGSFFNTATLEQISFKTARQHNFICKAVSLKDASDKGLLGQHNIIHPISGKSISLLEAMASGILECETKCILDTLNHEFVTLPEALRRGILLPNGNYIDTALNVEIPISSAVDKGFITSVTQKMIFEIDSVEDGENDFISFNDAIEKKIININEESYFNRSLNEKISFKEAAVRGLIKPQIYDLLCKPIGIKMNGNELNLIDCCKYGYVDFKLGHLKDPTTKQKIYIKDAVQRGLITPDGAEFLKGLLNITVTSANVVQRISKHITVPHHTRDITKNSTNQLLIKETHDFIDTYTDECVSLLKEDVSNMDISSKLKQPFGLKHPTSSIISSKSNSNSIECTTNVPQESDTSTKSNQHKTENIHSFIKDNSGQKKLLKEKDSFKANEVICCDKKSLNGDIKPRMEILELPPSGWCLKDAIDKKLYEPKSGLFTVPGTDRLVSFEETVKMEIINSKSALVKVPKSKQTVTLDHALEMKILDSTASYDTKCGTKISMQEAIDQNIITFCNINISDKNKKSFTVSTQLTDAHIDLENNDGKGDLNAHILSTVECPNFQQKNMRTSVTKDIQISLHENIKIFENLDAFNFPSTHRERILHKIPKRYIFPKDAAVEGFIDFQTADTLLKMFSNHLGNNENMDIVLEKELVDEKLIPDYSKSEFVTIKEALERGLVDKKTGNLLIPLAKTLSMDEAFSQGLLDKKSNKIIHPDSGMELTIEEGIMCDIINPYSIYIDPINETEMTLFDAIQQRKINSKSGTAELSNNMTIVEAVHMNMFRPLPSLPKSLPLLAFTFPTALQYSYIDIETKEFILPASGERIPLQRAFENADLLLIPVQPQREYFLLDDALTKKLINPKDFTFKHPVTGVLFDLREAMNTGLLIAKPVRLSVIPFSPSNASNLLESVSPDEFGKEGFRLNHSKVNESESNKSPILLDNADSLLVLNSGEFYDAASQNTYSVIEATKLNLQPVSNTKPVNIKYSLSEAFQYLYDESTNMFIIPSTQNRVSFEFLLKNNYLDLESTIYDIKNENSMSLREALNKNFIDDKTGYYIDKSRGSTLNPIDAAHLGFLSFISIPSSCIPKHAHSKMSGMSSSESIPIDEQCTLLNRPTSFQYNQQEIKLESSSDDTHVIDSSHDSLYNISPSQNTIDYNVYDMQRNVSTGIKSSQIITQLYATNNDSNCISENADQLNHNQSTLATVSKSIKNSITETNALFAKLETTGYIPENSYTNKISESKQKNEVSVSSNQKPKEDAYHTSTSKEKNVTDKERNFPKQKNAKGSSPESKISKNIVNVSQEFSNESEINIKSELKLPDSVSSISDNTHLLTTLNPNSLEINKGLCQNMIEGSNFQDKLGNDDVTVFSSNHPKGKVNYEQTTKFLSEENMLYEMEKDTTGDDVKPLLKPLKEKVTLLDSSDNTLQIKCAEVPVTNIEEMTSLLGSVKKITPYKDSLINNVSSNSSNNEMINEKSFQKGFYSDSQNLSDSDNLSLLEPGVSNSSKSNVSDVKKDTIFTIETDFQLDNQELDESSVQRLSNELVSSSFQKCIPVSFDSLEAEKYGNILAECNIRNNTPEEKMLIGNLVSQEECGISSEAKLNDISSKSAHPITTPVGDNNQIVLQKKEIRSEIEKESSVPDVYEFDMNEITNIMKISDFPPIDTTAELLISETNTNLEKAKVTVKDIKENPTFSSENSFLDEENVCSSAIEKTVNLSEETDNPTKSTEMATPDLSEEGAGPIISISKSSSHLQSTLLKKFTESPLNNKNNIFSNKDDLLPSQKINKLLPNKNQNDNVPSKDSTSIMKDLHHDINFSEAQFTETEFKESTLLSSSPIKEENVNFRKQIKSSISSAPKMLSLILENTSIKKETVSPSKDSEPTMKECIHSTTTGTVSSLEETFLPFNKMSPCETEPLEKTAIVKKSKTQSPIKDTFTKKSAPLVNALKTPVKESELPIKHIKKQIKNPEQVTKDSLLPVKERKSPQDNKIESPELRIGFKERSSSIAEETKSYSCNETFTKNITLSNKVDLFNKDKSTDEKNLRGKSPESVSFFTECDSLSNISERDVSLIGIKPIFTENETNLLKKKDSQVCEKVIPAENSNLEIQKEKQFNTVEQYSPIKDKNIIKVISSNTDENKSSISHSKSTANDSHFSPRNPKILKSVNDHKRHIEHCEAEFVSDEINYINKSSGEVYVYSDVLSDEIKLLSDSITNSVESIIIDAKSKFETKEYTAKNELSSKSETISSKIETRHLEEDKSNHSSIEQAIKEPNKSLNKNHQNSHCHSNQDASSKDFGGMKHTLSNQIQASNDVLLSETSATTKCISSIANETPDFIEVSSFSNSPQLLNLPLFDRLNEKNIEISNSLSLIQDFDEMTKTFQMPSVSQVTVKSAVSSGIIKIHSCFITIDGKRILLQKALDQNIISHDATVKILNNREIILLDDSETKVPGEITAVAVQENYQVCEENAAKLESWMKDIESKVADIGIIQEQILGLQHQIATVKILKEQLESQQILITTCLDQMRQLAQRGLEILNKEEINNLQKNLISLKKHYDCLLNDCDRLLKRLVAAFDELQKFKSETKSLREWMSRAQQQFTKIEAEMGSLSSLEAKSELVRSFSNDVIAHQADLRFIKLAAQKFVNESQDYLKALNTIRTNLPERLPALNSTESEVKLEVQEISTIFHNFLNDVNRLSDNYTLICSKYRLYAETVEKAKLWITDIKKSTKLSLSEHVADEPNAIQSQLNKVKLINMEVVGQSKLVENIYQSAKILTDTLENCNIRPMETKDIENTLHSLQEEYSHLSTMITNRIKELHAALIHSQDIQAGLERILKWLEESELTMKKHNKPISLIMEKLDEQVQENKILKSDISNQKQTIDVLMSTANEKLDTNPNITKKVASKLNDVSQRLDKLSECIVKRSLLLEQVSESVNAFQGMALEFEEWFTATFDRIENTDSVHRTDVDGFSSIIEYILNQKNSRKEDFDQMLKIGRSLISQKNISDTSFIKDKMEVLENQWKSLGESLNEKRQLGKVRSEQLGSYDNLHTKVLDWLMKMERVFEKLEPLALDQSLLRKQSTETVQLVKDHGEYSAVIEKLNHLGLSCDATVRGDGKGKSIKEKESPVKKPSSPTKKSPSKSKSNDNFAVYSTRSQISSQSPVSTISSGFSSSRSSTDNIGGIEGDLSVIQQQLLLVNDRYGLVGTKLSDRNQEISEIMEELKTYFNTIQILSTLVEIKSQQLPKDGFPSSQGVIDNQLKTLKEIQQELLEKQSDLNNIKMNVSNLLGRKKVVKGGIELQEEVFSIERKWASLLANIEEKCLFLKNVKEYQESFKHLQNWLSQKDKMLQVLGPIATEPRMVTSQVQQVQVMRDEFTSQESSVTRFKDLSITIVQYLQKVSISTVKIEEQISSIEAMWTDLSNNLNDREKNLEAASGVSKDFYKNLLELQSKLQQIGDKFDKLEEEEHNNEVLVKKIQELEEHLEKQRSPLTDACSVSEKLCEILSDSSSKSEIKYKVNVLEKSYSTIQKKIDLRKAEIESTLNEDKIFYKACNDIQKWLNETESKFSCSFPISTNLEKLSKEMKDHEARYKDVMNKEHEVYLCLSKGNDMLMKLSGKQEYATTKKKLDMIKKQFEKIKKIAIDKNTTIRSCLENCKSYYSLINMFQPWIESVEEKYKLFGAPSLKREMLVKQVKEVQALRSEMSLHSQEFHSIQRLSEEILLSCDADKETVKKQFDLLNNKWKKLNTDIITKIQFLEDLSQLLLEFEEKYRDLYHIIQRLEDRIHSHATIGEVSCDRMLLDRLEALLKETIEVNEEIKKVKKFSKLIIEKAGEKSDSSEIVKNLNSLQKKHECLQKKLEEKSMSMNSAYKVVSTFMESAKALQSEINSLEESFDELHSVARDRQLLKNQQKEIKEFKLKVTKLKQKYVSSKQICDELVRKDVCDTKTFLEQINSFNKKINRIEERVKEREITLETLITRLENFESTYTETMTEVNSLIKQEKTFEIVAGDVTSIRSQQETFKKMCDSVVKPLNKKIMEVNKLGQGLVQSASSDVDTNKIEGNLEMINHTWNDLQESVNEREKKLDIALLQSGKFQEALSGVQKWLNDTEEMVSNQKSPSFDFKVVKAQVQEQKFLKKMLLDRQNSVISLNALGSELVKTTKMTEIKQAETLMKNITARFEELISTAEERMHSLEETIPVAQEFQTISSSITDWLETIEKKLSTMSSIPVEESRIKTMINDHQVVSEDIGHHKKSLERLNVVSKKLNSMVNPTESDLLMQKVKSINEKFTEIETVNKNIGSQLNEAQKGVTSFFVTYTKVVTHIEEMTTMLASFQLLSIDVDKLNDQLMRLKHLNAKLDEEKKDIAKVINSGEDIMKMASGEDAIQMKEKLDTLNVKLTEVSNKLNERLKTAEESFPLVELFYSSINNLTSWLDSLERSLKSLDNSSLDVQSVTIKKLEEKIPEYRTVLDTINNTSARLYQLSPGEGSNVIENQVTRANHRFEKVCEQIQRKAERIQLTMQRKYDVIGDIDEIFEWFQETERKIIDAEGLTSEPSSLTTLLKEQKALCEDLNGQKSRVRDITTAAKKLMRESSSDDLSFINEKIESLKNRSNTVFHLCQERLSALEQALPLAQHFFEAHSDLGQWLDEVEGEAELLEAPALNSVQIKKQHEKNKDIAQSVQEHKPLVEKLNKTGTALTKLCKEEESDKLEVILESDNSRYNALRKILREHQAALEEALQATSQFSDKLEGILSALTSTADQLNNAEPISAHPDRIQEQINDNKAVLQDLDKRTLTLEAVKKAADDVIVKASKIDEPAVKDIKIKLDRLNDLWVTIQTAAHNRGKSLEEALVAAEKFWEELTSVMNALRELQYNLDAQEPPAVEPAAVHQQREVLEEIKEEITQTKPEVDHCRQAGQNLMQLCGEPDKPEIKKHIEDLDSAWENVTTLYYKREENLIYAMEKAMNYHDTLQTLLEFLDLFEDKFTKFTAVSSDIDSVKNQIKQLKEFKNEVDPHMVEVEALNRQAQELMERTSSDQAVSIREPLIEINKRWDDLLKNIVERQQEMEKVLLKLGQFQHSLEEHLIWITKTDKTLNELKPIHGDPQVIEVILAKHKVIANDIQAHQSSIDAIYRAGHQFMDTDRESEDARHTHNKLQDLKVQWQNLQDKSSERYRELEDALKEAQKFHQDIQDLLMWLNDIDAHFVTSKPVGGLPETATEQLNRFMDLYNEIDSNRYKVENILQQGQNYSKKSSENSTKSLQNNLRTLKQRWDSTLNKANDRKIKLEIALREAIEFHEALQTFVEWLTYAEKYLSNLKPVSRHMKAVLEQIEEHRNFQKELSSHREIMLILDKKGLHLKYFTQKQDQILIKNLLQSVQNRWEKVVSRAAERTRALDHGYKESKEFHDLYAAMSSWLDEAEKILDTSSPIGNDPKKIKKLLSKHKEFQRNLGSKQVLYDGTMKSGRVLKDKSPKQDVPLLQNMLDEIKTRWNKVCSKSVARQRQLEEGLLFSGQFKEAVLALMDWIEKSITQLSTAKPYHGDLDTVTSLIDQHKSFEEEFKNKGLSLDSVCKTAVNLKKQANSSDVESITSQVEELNSKWKIVSDLNLKKITDLQSALQLAEELYKLVHMLLEWLSDAEMKLRFISSLADDEESCVKLIQEHEIFLSELEKQEITKNKALELAHDILKKCHPDGISVIRHWITIMESRWEEISTWSKQREQRLQEHILSLRELFNLLEELLAWLNNAESNLTALEAEQLTEDLPTLDRLIEEHQVFMNELTKKQEDTDKIKKAFSSKRHQSKNLGASQVKERGKDKEKPIRSGTPTNVKSATPSRGQFESEVKHSKAKLLLDKWRIVWILAMERQRRLQDKRNYLLEFDRIKHFNFNDWRLRYLGWLNNKKSRIMDQYKKIDKNNCGKVTKQEFIDGILKSKFETSRLEMEKVADVFDRNGDGFIDNKEYIETLRPEREGGPKTEAEKIQDEVQRQVAACTCVHRFKVYQVGEGKYRFGDSQKLRLVRILRSTVMVRVGGGWVALDEFLVKNDPCRAKGRTNLELREQFILADGVSQSMAPFKPKPSPNSSVSSQSGTNISMPSAGPITKIREKSERSTPMMRKSAENSSDISGPSFSGSDTFSNKSSLSKVSTSLSRLSLKDSSYKSPSRSSSRQGSRPSSRAPSDLSQDGIEDYKTKHKQTVSKNSLTQRSASNSGIVQPKPLVETSKIPSVKKSMKLPINRSPFKRDSESPVKK